MGFTALMKIAVSHGLDYTDLKCTTSMRYAWPIYRVDVFVGKCTYYSKLIPIKCDSCVGFIQLRGHASITLMTPISHDCPLNSLSHE